MESIPTKGGRVQIENLATKSVDPDTGAETMVVTRRITKFLGQQTITNERVFAKSLDEFYDIFGGKENAPPIDNLTAFEHLQKSDAPTEPTDIPVNSLADHLDTVDSLDEVLRLFQADSRTSAVRHYQARLRELASGLGVSVDLPVDVDPTGPEQGNTEDDEE